MQINILLSWREMCPSTSSSLPVLALGCLTLERCFLLPSRRGKDLYKLYFSASSLMLEMWPYVVRLKTLPRGGDFQAFFVLKRIPSRGAPWEKKWVTVGDTSLRIFKWVPVADSKEKEKSKSNNSAAREPNGFPSDASANSSLLLEFQDENSNQSSMSDVYQLKVDSSTNSSPSPQQSESLSPAHTSDFRTDDSQPPTLGQEILEEPSLPASEVADEPPTLTKEEPVPLETQAAEDEEDSGAPPLKRFCVEQSAVLQAASES